MPVPSSLVGATTPASTITLNSRWPMAYAAAIDDTSPDLLDTSLPGGIVAHPLFSVCLEWPHVLAARDAAPRYLLLPAERLRGVHASHDLVIHRLARPGDVLTTSAVVEGIERRGPGAYEVLRLETVDHHGLPVAATRMGTLFLGVGVDGPDRPAPEVAPRLSSSGPSGTRLAATGGRDEMPDSQLDEHPVIARRRLGAGAPHVYTEGARIWNPIHTDVTVARAAGLPGIILHGTATLAMAVSEIVTHFGDGDPRRVRRVSGRFSATVCLPSIIAIHAAAQSATDSATGEHQIWFSVLNEAGQPAVSNGRVVLGPH